MEVILGYVERGARVSTHAHLGIEQARYFLEGEAELTVEGQTHQVRAGDMCFFLADVSHSVRVKSERAKMLIIYSPPDADSPDKVVRN